jgi:hypothetical protein
MVLPSDGNPRFDLELDYIFGSIDPSSALINVNKIL